MTTFHGSSRKFKKIRFFLSWVCRRESRYAGDGTRFLRVHSDLNGPMTSRLCHRPPVRPETMAGAGVDNVGRMDGKRSEDESAIFYCLDSCYCLKGTRQSPDPGPTCLRCPQSSGPGIRAPVTPSTSIMPLSWPTHKHTHTYKSQTKTDQICRLVSPPRGPGHMSVMRLQTQHPDN